MAGSAQQTDVCFLSQPYHRGGVTQWMANAFNSWSDGRSKAYFVSVLPKVPFRSACGKPLVMSLLDRSFQKNVFAKSAGWSFEFATISGRAAIYKELILTNVPPAVPLIPSDDEACWMAAASIASRNPVYFVVHSYGDESYYKLLTKYRGHARGIVCVSSRIARTLAARFGNERLENVEVIPCGVPLNHISLDRMQKRRRVAWVGRMEERSKRVSDIPLILKGLESVLTDVEFHVIGDGPMLQFLERFRMEYSGPNPLILHGWRNHDQVMEILRSSMVLLQTSNYEGMSLSVMEALANGCVVVSSRVSGVEDLEGRHECLGIINLFKIGDVKDAVEKIKKVFERYDANVVKKAVNIAIENFDIKTTNSRLSAFMSRDVSGQIATNRMKIPFLPLLVSPALSLLRRARLAVSDRIAKKSAAGIAGSLKS